MTLNHVVVRATSAMVLLAGHLFEQKEKQRLGQSWSGAVDSLPPAGRALEVGRTNSLPLSSRSARSLSLSLRLHSQVRAHTMAVCQTHANPSSDAEFDASPHGVPGHGG